MTHRILNQKVALVTGSGGGMGIAMAQANVVLEYAYWLTSRLRRSTSA